MRLNRVLEDHQVRQNVQKENLMIKICIILLLFFVIIVVSIIIFGNYFDIINENNIHLDKEIITQHNSHDKTEIEIQTLENIKRSLSDTQINTWTVNDQINTKVSSLSDGNFVVVWQSYLQDGSGYGINGQIFYTYGAKRGNEVYISNSTALNQINQNVNVAAASSGKFMVI